MIAAALLLLAAQTPAAPARPTVGNEAQARAALAKQGLSPAGVDTVIGTVKRRQPESQALLNRFRQAAQAVKVAGARRPVNVDAFEAALNAQQAAVAALARAQQALLIEQLRAASPADRAILLRGFTAQPAPKGR